MVNISHPGSDHFRKETVAYLAAVPFLRGDMRQNRTSRKGADRSMKKELLRQVKAEHTEDVLMRYYLLESVRAIPDIGNQTVYGILVELGESGVTGAVEDISSKREEVVALLNKLADCTVSPRHIADVGIDSISVA